MIWTLTVNPSLDYNVQLENFAEGKVNRSSRETITAGGKGINVSIVLKNLGIASTALGFAGGWTGVKIEALLSKSGIDTDFVYLSSGDSRINVKIKSAKETEINAGGPFIDNAHVELLFMKLNSLNDGDTLVLAGSIPLCLGSDFYNRIMKFLADKKINFVVDATGGLLLETLKYRPFLIKPNNHELGQIFNVEIASKEDALFYAKKLAETGARNVLVSLAGDGAVLFAEDGSSYECAAPKGTVVNSVGAGDSMVAGFIAGWNKKHDYEYALKTGIACGSASAFSEGLATADKIEELFNTL
ncbi:MAG: 1-phosphofructokinase [Treponema sp.]|nr:1-phosphofructokinase [Spirochaetales bacterium]MDY5812379.1 1-phosphofructokinase [Treponema sp.]